MNLTPRRIGIRRPVIRILILSGVLPTLGCSTLNKLVRATNSPIAKQLAHALPPDVAKKVAFYQKYSSKYLKFTDGANLDEGDVLDVLSDAGVIQRGGANAATSAASTRGSVVKRKGGDIHRVPPPVANYTGGYRWPTDAGVVSSEYGSRWGKQHKGIDIAADVGEPIRASANGSVIYSGSGMRGYGNVLLLQHDERHTTLYAHNDKLLVKGGAQVAGGQHIANLGNTGVSTGPHVHFEFRRGETPVNPRDVLPSSQFSWFDPTPPIRSTPRSWDEKHLLARAP